MMKAIQNIFIVLAGKVKKVNPDAEKRLRIVAGSIRDARVSMSWFKLPKDITVFQSYLKNPSLTPITQSNSYVNFLNWGMMGSHFAYTLFENTAFYMRIRATKVNKSAFYNKLFCSFKLSFIGFAVARKMYDLKNSQPSKDPEKDEQKKNILNIQIFSNLADVFSAAGGAGIPKALFGKNFPEALRCLGGAASAVTAVYAYKLQQKL